MFRLSPLSQSGQKVAYLQDWFILSWFKLNIELRLDINQRDQKSLKNTKLIVVQVNLWNSEPNFHLKKGIYKRITIKLQKVIKINELYQMKLLTLPSKVLE